MKKVLIVFHEGGENGGPYNSHKRILSSPLNKNYNFIEFYIPKGRIGLFNIKLLKFIIRGIKNEKPDIIHFPGLQLTGFYMALATRFYKSAKSIVAVHGTSSESIEIQSTILKKRIMNLLEKVTLKWVDVVYGVSDYVGSLKVIEKYKSKYYGCIYNMLLDTNVGEQSPKLDLEIESNRVIVTSVGRIEIEKGYLLLSKVIKNDTNDNVTFVIVGDGSYLKTMREELSYLVKTKKVVFTGYLEDVNSVLDQSDIFISTTLHETFGMSIAEAGQRGSVLIASDVGGIKEIIDNGKNGFLIDLGNVREFNEKINVLVNNEEIMIKMQEESLTTISQRFKNEEIVKRIMNLYENGVKNEGN